MVEPWPFADHRLVRNVLCKFMKKKGEQFHCSSNTARRRKNRKSQNTEREGLKRYSSPNIALHYIAIVLSPHYQAAIQQRAHQRTYHRVPTEPLLANYYQESGIRNQKAHRAECPSYKAEPRQEMGKTSLRIILLSTRANRATPWSNSLWTN